MNEIKGSCPITEPECVRMREELADLRARLEKAERERDAWIAAVEETLGRFSMPMFVRLDKPDHEAINKHLKAGGFSRDRISADMARFVCNLIKDLAKEALASDGGE